MGKGKLRIVFLLKYQPFQWTVREPRKDDWRYFSTLNNTAFNETLYALMLPTCKISIFVIDIVTRVHLFNMIQRLVQS